MAWICYYIPQIYVDVTTYPCSNLDTYLTDLCYKKGTPDIIAFVMFIVGWVGWILPDLKNKNNNDDIDNLWYQSTNDDDEDDVNDVMMIQ